MRYFERFTSNNLQISNQLANALALVSEYKGKETLFKSQNPEKLLVLKQTAVVESVESSNRIEQVTAAPGRLVGLMRESLEPRDRSEQEIVGYRKVLDRIHSNHANIPVTENTLKLFHRDLFLFDEHKGGKYKSSGNEIIRREDGVETVVFNTVAPYLVAPELEKLHENYKSQCEQSGIHPLFLTASYVLDFLCIHPFADGNGRIARLMSLLLLYHHGFEVGGYISLERIIEETKDSYYDTLNKSSQGWHENQHDVMPWIEYFIGVVLILAYRQFEGRMAGIDEGESKSDSVVSALRRLPKTFKVSDIAKRCPHVSAATIKATLSGLKKQRLVKCVRRGETPHGKKPELIFGTKQFRKTRVNYFGAVLKAIHFGVETRPLHFMQVADVKERSQ